MLSKSLPIVSKDSGKDHRSVIEKNNMVEFTITDNGIGIPKKDIYDIFTPFKMGSNTANQKQKAEALDLRYAKQQ